MSSRFENQHGAIPRWHTHKAATKRLLESLLVIWMERCSFVQLLHWKRVLRLWEMTNGCTRFRKRVDGIAAEIQRVVVNQAEWTIVKIKSGIYLFF